MKTSLTFPINVVEYNNRFSVNIDKTLYSIVLHISAGGDEGELLDENRTRRMQSGAHERTDRAGRDWYE